MTEHPILFSGPMVAAILSGAKTQTRRLIKPQPKVLKNGTWYVPYAAYPTKWCYLLGDHQHGWAKCPYGSVGATLWIREAWNVFALSSDHDESWPLKKIPESDPRLDDDARRSICVDYPVASLPGQDGGKGPWRPGIHMPRWASRISLLITDVRVQRLQDISEADAAAEGVENPETEREEHDWSICPQCGGTRLYAGFGSNYGVLPDCDCEKCDTHKKRFQHLWSGINGPESWSANPWVFAISFRVEQAERAAA